MTIGLTNYAMEKGQNWFLRGTAYTSPATVYLGLDSTLGNEAGGGTEISAAGYARQAMTLGSYISRRVSNSAGMTYTAGADWPEIVGGRVWDAASGGNAMGWGRLSPKPMVSAGQSYSLAPGEVSISINGSTAAGRMGDWYVQRLLEKLFKATAHASLSASLKAHLALVAPSVAGTGYTMVSGSGYTPQTAAFNAWAANRNYLTSDITFTGAAAAAWGEIIEWCLYDGTNPASDHFLFGCPLAPTYDAGLGAAVVLRAADSYVSISPGPDA
jgi:hypothetical protein